MSDLRFLLRLVDDPSPRVAEKVAARLAQMGPQLWAQIREENIELSDSQHLALQRVWALGADHRLETQWEDLARQNDGTELLEDALLTLARWQSGTEREHGNHLLDTLAREFTQSEYRKNSVSLATFLFDFRGLRGASAHDFYNPLNSNVVHALENGVGLPITLTCIFILVGARLDIAIEGCNFPGHFLARDGRRRTVFDPYNGGRVLSEKEVTTLQKAAPAEMKMAASAQTIIERVLRNLSVAYYQNGETDKAELMLRLTGRLGS